MNIDQNIETMRVLKENLLYSRNIAEAMMLFNKTISTKAIVFKLEEALLWVSKYQIELEDSKAVLERATSNE